MGAVEPRWWQEMFASPEWQAVQLGWGSVEDAEEQVERVIEALRVEPGDRVLDVPCGTGRIAGPLAARGYEVVGVDMTERFLEEARATGGGGRFDRADMRELAFDAEFDAAICFWGSFGYFDEAGNLAQARAAARALRPGGRYLIDTPSAETVLPRFTERSWFEVGDTVVLQENSYRIAEGRTDTVWTFVRDGRRRSHRSSMRLYTLHELTELLREAGFASFEARDDALEPFELGSERLWLVATV